MNDNLIVLPMDDGSDVEVIRGPNIKPVPDHQPLGDTINDVVLIKLEDNITTDHIMPSNSKLLPFRSNVPELANHCLTPSDPEFPERARREGGGLILAGHNYGQGSSREHAALAPLALGVRGVLAKSFARIHEANLINNGILPLTFVNEEDYEKIEMGDRLEIRDARTQLEAAHKGAEVEVINVDRDETYPMTLAISSRERDMLLAGGLLNLTTAD